jgi:hypothetical protein
VKVIQGVVERVFKGADILLCRKSTPHGNVPDALVWASIIGGTGAGIPWPLMHRHKTYVGIVLDKRLRAIAMVHVPVYDQDALATVHLAGIMGSDSYVPKEAEAHGAVAEGVVSRGTYRAEAAALLSSKRQIYSI